MKATAVCKGVHRFSANISDDLLFEGIWPLPHGMTMNSYLVQGERSALIDGVCGWDGVPETLYRQLDEISVSVGSINHVVLNHLEPDHTGWLSALKDITRNFEIVTTQKGAELAKAFYGIEENVRVVRSGDRISLGNGKELLFVTIPNVHWPETMASFETGTGTLFSGDAFGSFGSVGGYPHDDQLTEGELKFYEDEALRYFSNIIAAFSISVRRALKKLDLLDIRIVASAHGIIWRKDPERVIKLYKRFSDYMEGPAEPAITLIWGSMYGNTEAAVEAATQGVLSEDIDVHVHRVPEEHVSFILASAWRSTGIILGMPTYEFKMFPPMAHVLDDLRRKKVVGKKGFRFGSYGWTGGAQKELDEIAANLGWDFLPSVEFNGAPRDSDFELIYQRAKELAQKIKEATFRRTFPSLR